MYYIPVLFFAVFYVIFIYISAFRYFRKSKPRNFDDKDRFNLTLILFGAGAPLIITIQYWFIPEIVLLIMIVWLIVPLAVYTYKPRNHKRK
jgi:phosphatidylserine synthase